MQNRNLPKTSNHRNLRTPKFTGRGYGTLDHLTGDRMFEFLSKDHTQTVSAGISLRNELLVPVGVLEYHSVRLHLRFQPLELLTSLLVQLCLPMRDMVVGESS